MHGHLYVVTHSQKHLRIILFRIFIEITLFSAIFKSKEEPLFGGIFVHTSLAPYFYFYFFFWFSEEHFIVLIVQYLGVTAGIEPAT